MADYTPPPRLAKDLLSYYLKHPTTVETTEGLARWRLLEEYVERTIRETEQAIHWLVERGFLREVVRPGGRSVYVINPDRRDQAEALVEDAATDRHGGR